MKRALSLLLIVTCLAGCGRTPDSPPPLFPHGVNYAIVTTNAVIDGVPQAGRLSLHYYPNGPQGSSTLVWPFLTAEDDVVFDKLVIFNGALSEDVAWRYYPALLAYAGTGKVVEISHLACRRIPGAKEDWTNYAFSVLSAGSNFVRLDASQRLPVNANQPKRLALELDTAEILKTVAAAQTNVELQVFDGVKYYVAE